MYILKIYEKYIQNYIQKIKDKNLKLFVFLFLYFSLVYQKCKKRVNKKRKKRKKKHSSKSLFLCFFFCDFVMVEEQETKQTVMMTTTINNHDKIPQSSEHQQNNSDDGFVAENESSSASSPSAISSSQNSSDDSDEAQDSEFYLRFFDLSQEFQKPFQSSTRMRRLRYTCADITPNVTPLIVAPGRFAALGTTAGSVYLFELFENCDHDRDISFRTEHRSTLICEDLIGAVSSLQFSPVQLYFDHSTPLPTLPAPPPQPQPVHQVNRNETTASPVSHQSSNNKLFSATSGDLELSSNSGNSDVHRQTSTKSLFTSKQSKRRASIDISNSTATTATNSSNHLRNIFLAIGGTKGHLIIIEFDPKFVPQNNKNTKKQWNVVYKNDNFTKHSITILRWDNSERYEFLLYFF